LQFFNNSNGHGVSVEMVGSGTVTASFKSTEFSGNDSGLALATANSGVINAAATDCVMVNNHTFAIVSSGGSVNLALTSGQIAGNAIGLQIVNSSGIDSALWLAQSIVANNVTAGFRIISISNSFINSYADNYFANNGSDTGGLTPVSKQ
jgi:hypothetical protein